MSVHPLLSQRHRPAVWRVRFLLPHCAIPCKPCWIAVKLDYQRKLGDGLPCKNVIHDTNVLRIDAGFGYVFTVAQDADFTFGGFAHSRLYLSNASHIFSTVV